MQQAPPALLGEPAAAALWCQGTPADPCIEPHSLPWYVQRLGSPHIPTHRHGVAAVVNSDPPPPPHVVLVLQPSPHNQNKVTPWRSKGKGWQEATRAPHQAPGGVKQQGCRTPLHMEGPGRGACPSCCWTPVLRRKGCQGGKESLAAAITAAAWAHAINWFRSVHPTTLLQPASLAPIGWVCRLAQRETSTAS
jgi:hypothetical protein